MCRCTSRGTCLHYPFKQIITMKCLVRVTCISFVASILWIQLNKEDSPLSNNLTQEALKNVGQDFRFAELYRKKNRLPKSLKYILLWTRQDYAPFYNLGSGQRQFIQKNCSVINCYITDDRNFFGGDINKFDAVAFNGRNIKSATKAQLPQSRSPHQKYIFVNMESANNYPVCNGIFDGFFNWTSTYRLDSDVPYPYILIRNIDGEVVGPKYNMKWIEDMHELDDDIYQRLQNKSKAAAWFVSNCDTRSGRKEFVEKLQKALDPYDMKIDIYGKCGTLQCPRDRQADCNAMLERDYYFYLAMENSFAEDYVTEKLLTALQHDAIPIVFGGANYSRFLPPGSYLDARAQSPDQLASIMHRLMESPQEYSQYFRWKYHYTYHNPGAVENVCSLCTALNNRTMLEMPTVYQNFRSWWEPDYKKLCRI